jgi:hypothetical protein
MLKRHIIIDSILYSQVFGAFLRLVYSMKMDANISIGVIGIGCFGLFFLISRAGKGSKDNGKARVFLGTFLFFAFLACMVISGLLTFADTFG